MKKNGLSVLQENCFCFCDEDASREAPFQVPIEVPEGVAVDPAEAVTAVTWSTDVMNGELGPKGVTEISLSPLSRGGGFDRLFETLRTIVFSLDSTRAYFLEPYSEPFLINNVYVVNTAAQQ